MPTAFNLCLKQLNAGSRAWGNRRFFSTLTPFSNCDSTIQTGGYQKRVKRMDTTDGHTSAHCTISTVVTFGNTRTHSRHTHTHTIRTSSSSTSTTGDGGRDGTHGSVCTLCSSSSADGVCVRILRISTCNELFELLPGPMIYNFHECFRLDAIVQMCLEIFFHHEHGVGLTVDVHAHDTGRLDALF
jgi:hypothetical protein